MSDPVVLKSDPWIFARDSDETIRHLIDVLGFQHWFDPDEEMRVGGVRGPSAFFVRIRENPAYLDAIADLALGARPVTRISVQHIDDLHAIHVANGARIVVEIGDRPWGDREYTVEEINGQLLTFSEEDIERVRER